MEVKVQPGTRPGTSAPIWNKDGHGTEECRKHSTQGMASVGGAISIESE